jgi:hypothetical protein
LVANPNPATPNQSVPFRAIGIDNTPPSPPLRSVLTQGQRRQANKELFAPGALPAPSNCFIALPTTGDYWCFDPVKKRRGQAMGEPAQPIHDGANTLDTDAPPALPVFTSLVPRSGGTVRFNDVSLLDCPPASFASSAEKELIEAQEEAAELGIRFE